MKSKYSPNDALTCLECGRVVLAFLHERLPCGHPSLNEQRRKLDAERSEQNTPRKSCQVPGCDKPYEMAGRCRGHYEQFVVETMGLSSLKVEP